MKQTAKEKLKKQKIKDDIFASLKLPENPLISELVGRFAGVVSTRNVFLIIRSQPIFEEYQTILKAPGSAEDKAVAIRALRTPISRADIISNLRTIFPSSELRKEKLPDYMIYEYFPLEGKTEIRLNQAENMLLEKLKQNLGKPKSGKKNTEAYRVSVLHALNIPCNTQVLELTDRFQMLGSVEPIAAIIRNQPIWKVLTAISDSSAKNEYKQAVMLTTAPFSAEHVIQVLKQYYPTAQGRNEAIPEKIYKEFFLLEWEILDRQRKSAEAEAERQRQATAIKSSQISLVQREVDERNAVTRGCAVEDIQRERQEFYLHGKVLTDLERKRLITETISLPRLNLEVPMTPEAVKLAETWRHDTEERRRQTEEYHRVAAIAAEDLDLHRRASTMAETTLVLEKITTESISIFREYVFHILKSNAAARTKWGVTQFIDSFLQHALVSPAELQKAKPVQPILPPQIVKLTAVGTERTIHIRDSGAQANFRRRIMMLWDSLCVVEGIGLAGTLEAAHISHGTDYSDDNGIPMTPTAHALFDRHLIAIHPDTLIVHISPLIPEYAKFHGKLLTAPIALNRTGLVIRWKQFGERRN